MARRAPPAVRPVRAAVAAALSPLGDVPVGVACSGGADSVALADAAAAVAGAARVTLLHVDHRLHPGSGAVAAAVAALATTLGVGCEVLAVDVPAGASLEDQARRARYAALDDAAARRGLAAVLTGHTRRDQAETVLLRLLRGTGPRGLAGIPAVRGRYLRPLLAVDRPAIEAYVAARGLPVADDPMNHDERFARAVVRHRVMPLLQTLNPRVEEALARLAGAAAEWAAPVEQAAAAAVAAARPRPGGWEVPLAALRAAGPAAGKLAVARLAAPAMLDADHLDAAWRLATDGRPGAGVDAPGLRLERSFDALVAVTAAVVAPALVVRGPDGPYEVRPWQPGDRMRPAARRGRSRKLSDLLAEARVPRADRGRARVVVRLRDREVVWAEHVGPAFGASIAVAPGGPGVDAAGAGAPAALVDAAAEVDPGD